MINAVSVKKARKLFWECPFVKSFWNEISNWMKKSSCFLNEEFSFLTCIGLVNDTTNLLFHHALLIARYHIYFSNQKGFNPSWELFFRTFLNCLDYERRYAIKTGTLRNFNAKWGAFIQENDLQSYFLCRDVRRTAIALTLQRLFQDVSRRIISNRAWCVCVRVWVCA